MPSYKLTYFDGRGRGELCRYVFLAADKDFEDIRLTFEKWTPLKPSSPFGQLPFLEVDGKKLAQSAAIARFLAREFGLAGEDSWEQALTDQFVELADDLFREVVKWFFEKDEEKKAELKKNLDDVLYPKFCGIFEKALEQNGGQFFVGKSVTMPTYKLTYFDARGRGELCRYVFLAADKDFEDARIIFETWPSLKPSTPFGQLPFLEVDGKRLAQSTAIARFLAREFGLDGKDGWEQALIDQYMGLAEDLFKDIVKWFFEKDEEKKAELKKNLDDVLYPKFCGMYEKALEQNGGQFFVGKSLTLADLAVLNIFDTPVQNSPNLLDKFPKLKAHRERILSTPKLASYVKDRKETPI